MTEPPTALTAWTPDQPLRADADKNQIGERFIHLIGEFYRRFPEASANGALNVAIEVAWELRRAALPADFPSLWWCESCDAHVACEAKHGDLVCPHHHIVASFTP